MRPFLEILWSALTEDYRWPVLEVLAFVLTVDAFLFASFSLPTLGTAAITEETLPYFLTSSVLGQLPLILLVGVQLKNLALGFGGDLERGVIQTYLSYPLRRHSVLSAKIVSTIASLVFFVLVQVFALALLAPNVILPHLGLVLLTMAAALQQVLLAGAILLVFTLLLRKSSLALVMGLASYFVLITLEVVALSFAARSVDPLGVQTTALIFPGVALGWYFGAVPALGYIFLANNSWNPTWLEVVSSLVAGYMVVFLILLLSYLYFSRRVNL